MGGVVFFHLSRDGKHVAVPTRIARPAAFQIFDFALLTHDPGKCSHPGVILSGATTYFSFFLAGPPVSFNLAQCVREGNFSLESDGRWGRFFFAAPRTVASSAQAGFEESPDTIGQRAS